MAVALKKSIISAFKMHGLSLRSEASNYLAEILAPINIVEREDWIDRILNEFQRQASATSLVDMDTLQNVIKECQAGTEGDDQVLSVIDAFDVPKYTFLPEKKTFVLQNTITNTNSKIFGGPASKSLLFKERYNLIHQRTMRHKLFTAPVVGSKDETRKFQLKSIEYLLSCSAKIKDIIVLGMLSQLKERKYFLEDLTGAVELNLERMKVHSGIITENCFVLAEGWYEDQVFHVTAFGFPPVELSKTTRKYFGNMNFFGGGNSNSKCGMKMQQYEKEHPDAMFVILSDVLLDHAATLQKLELMFIGFRDVPPVAFIFCGNFLSGFSGVSRVEKLKQSFENFMKMLLNFPTLCSSSKFVFVPSASEIGPSRILPRPALPGYITENFMKNIPNAIFASNPCRIRYCTQEIVIFREDIITKMMKNSVCTPYENISTHFAKTIIAQAHLSPLPLQINPVYWENDQSLWLYPLPDLVVVADHQIGCFQESTDAGCTVINPGSFSCSDFAFQVYYPSTRTIEESRIDS